MSDFDIDIPFLSPVEYEAQQPKFSRVFHPLTGLPLSRPTLDSVRVTKEATHEQNNKAPTLFKAEDSKVR